jgi:hypothetical protein
MVLNSTNAQLIARITGHDQDIERNWIGQPIILFDDPNVSYGGKLVGGIRVRAPKKGAVLPKQPPAVDPNYPPQEDDLPF